MSTKHDNRNRQQRRHGLQPIGLQRQPQPQGEVQLQVDYAHNGRKVVVMFNQPVSNIMMTIEQADAFISSIEQVKAGLLQHMAGQSPAVAEVQPVAEEQQNV